MSPLIDKEQIILRLPRLKTYRKFLKQLQKLSFKEIENDPFKTGALLHYIQLCAEICIDIGQTLIAAENFEIPEDSAQIFIVLGKEKIIPKKFAETFLTIARFRNLLVHEYIKIDLKKVYTYLQNDLSQFETFAKAIAKYIQV